MRGDLLPSDLSVMHHLATLSNISRNIHSNIIKMQSQGPAGLWLTPVSFTQHVTPPVARRPRRTPTGITKVYS
jgi:hypothetical protein